MGAGAGAPNGVCWDPKEVPLLNGDGDDVVADKPNGEVVEAEFPKGETVFAVLKGDGDGARPPRTKGDAVVDDNVLPVDAKGDGDGVPPPKDDVFVGGICESAEPPKVDD